MQASLETNQKQTTRRHALMVWEANAASDEKPFFVNKKLKKLKIL